MNSRDYIEQVERALMKSEREVSSGICVRHSFETPDFVQITTAMIDARYEAEAEAKEAKELKTQLATAHAENERLRKMVCPHCSDGVPVIIDGLGHIDADGIVRDCQAAEATQEAQP